MTPIILLVLIVFLGLLFYTNLIIHHDNNKNTEILGMFRIKNNFGGFWGSGVTFDVRQLYMKGVVAKALRYQLGDLNLKPSLSTCSSSLRTLVIVFQPDILIFQKVNVKLF
jgi:hypothetical protein